MKKIFISSPYTIGDVAVNVKNQIDVANELMNLGLAPFVPLYSHFQHMAHPRPYEDWLKINLEWVKVCDGLLRLNGESKGADREVEFAKSYGIPVFYDIEELEIFYTSDDQITKDKRDEDRVDWLREQDDEKRENLNEGIS